MFDSIKSKSGPPLFTMNPQSKLRSMIPEIVLRTRQIPCPSDRLNRSSHVLLSLQSRYRKFLQVPPFHYSSSRSQLPIGSSLKIFPRTIPLGSSWKIFSSPTFFLITSTLFQIAPLHRKIFWVPFSSIGSLPKILSSLPRRCGRFQPAADPDLKVDADILLKI